MLKNYTTETVANEYVFTSPILGSPVSDMVHVGVSNNKYIGFNETSRLEIKSCQAVESPFPIDTNIDVGCVNAYGRYVYISLIRESSGDGCIQLSEVEVYMGE